MLSLIKRLAEFWKYELHYEYSELCNWTDGFDRIYSKLVQMSYPNLKWDGS